MALCYAMVHTILCTIRSDLSLILMMTMMMMMMMMMMMLSM